MSIIVNTVAAAFLAGALSGPIPVQDLNPRDAVRKGLARPLGQILGAVQRNCPGQFLDARLRKGRGGRLVYHIKLLRPGGKRAKLAVDAQSGAIIGGRC